MNIFCSKDCKFKYMCKLNEEQTLRCKVADDKGVDHSNKHLISGLTSKDICKMQGRDGDLK